MKQTAITYEPSQSGFRPANLVDWKAEYDVLATVKLLPAGRPQLSNLNNVRKSEIVKLIF